MNFLSSIHSQPFSQSHQQFSPYKQSQRNLGQIQKQNSIKIILNYLRHLISSSCLSQPFKIIRNYAISKSNEQLIYACLYRKKCLQNNQNYTPKSQTRQQKTKRKQKESQEFQMNDDLSTINMDTSFMRSIGEQSRVHLQNILSIPVQNRKKFFNFTSQTKIVKRSRSKTDRNKQINIQEIHVFRQSIKASKNYLISPASHENCYIKIPLNCKKIRLIQHPNILWKKTSHLQSTETKNCNESCLKKQRRTKTLGNCRYCCMVDKSTQIILSLGLQTK